MKLRFTRPSLADLDGVLAYIHERSPQGAKRAQGRIRLLLDLLAHHPQLGQATDQPGIRRLVVSPYPYLVFEIGLDEIIIHAVRHASRNPSSMPGH
ncbi:MAG: type II toxin-antitoxin system RelE/ParE family toxin [Methylobacteriaceae bacterium]|nr:type II toxin-antitoxin system RelE/ParE family toxin [Methylobacteriaceae bacterium]